MCYRDNVPPLSFDGIHTACISGDNGSGKSALIDAMTWALWGQTRAKTDDELIHLGQTEMEVEFDFTVGEQEYRVIRKHAKPKRRQASGQSSLDLFVASGDGFKVISGDGIRQTEQKIRDTLHMDYDTFINSALLLQGRADEFTVANPAKRKQVLADILGLSVYDELEGRAKELTKQQETEKEQLNSTIQDISDELAQKPTSQAEFEVAQSELSRLEVIIKEQEFRLDSLRREKEALVSKKSQLVQLEEQITETEKDRKRWEDQAKQHHSRLREHEQLISQRSTVEAGYAQLTEVKKLEDELNQKNRLFTTLNERKHQVEMAIERAQTFLITEHKLAQNKTTELESRSQKIPQLKNELQQVQIEGQQLSEAEETLYHKRRSRQELQARVHYLETEKTRLEQEIRELGEKLKLLTTQTETKCPLCETELEIEGLKLIESKYTADRDRKSDALRSNHDELARQETKLELWEGEISRLETRVNRDRASIQGRVSIINRAISEAEESSRKLDEAREKLAEIEEHLAKKDFAVTDQEALHELEGELAKLDYDSHQYEQVRQRLTTLEQFEASKLKLEEADRLINREKEEVAKDEEAAQGRRRGLDVDNQKRQNLTRELDLLPLLINDLTKAETEYQGQARQQKQAQERMGNVKGKLQRCSELEIRKKEKEKLLTETSRLEEIYKDLAQAFGKKGIQALLIEVALPEIEVEANELLGRMTDNRMHVKIETQRETKKGNVMETLDINVSDDLGTRNYEMFSGGEAFRINVAIRIALSRLLARRAGAPLPTLVIDEGFGTQDSTGIGKLKEAINSIQDDFDKILVITHVEDLRDTFPIRIDVIKTAEGSTISLS